MRLHASRVPPGVAPARLHCTLLPLLLLGVLLHCRCCCWLVPSLLAYQLPATAEWRSGAAPDSGVTRRLMLSVQLQAGGCLAAPSCLPARPACKRLAQIQLGKLLGGTRQLANCTKLCLQPQPELTCYLQLPLQAGRLSTRT